MSSPLNKPDAPLNWDAASVDLPPMPVIPPGADAMSMTIAGVLPTLTAPLTANVAALQAKETMFSGKLGAAESAYQNADDSGGQSVGQMSSMLGQVGQMAQQAGGAGGGMGSFGQILQQVMQAAQGGGGSQGSGSPGSGSQGGGPQGSQGGGAPAAGGQSTGSTGGGAPQQQPRDDPGDGNHGDHDDHDARDDRRERTPLQAAAPGDGRHAAGPVPVTPTPRGGGDDLGRRM